MDGTTVRHLNPRLLGLMEWLDDTAFKVSRLWMWIFERRGKGPILPPPPPSEESEKPSKPPKSIIVHRALHKLRRKDVEMLVEPCPAIYSVLGFLKKRGIPMALVSNGLGKGYGLDIVQKFGLADFFNVTIFREDIKKSKPHPEPLIKAIEQLNLPMTEDDVIWYIGDRHKDITAAQAADPHTKAKIIPIAYAINAAVAAIEKGYGPDHILMSYQDVYTVLDRLFKEKT